MRDDLEGSWPEIGHWPEIKQEVKSTRTRTAGEGQPGEDGKEKDSVEPEGKVEDGPDDNDDGEGPGGGQQGEGM